MTAPETKSFTLADILTHTTGRLLTPIGDVYLFLEWVTGEQGVMTHQLPRLSREVTPFLEKTFPDLAAIDIAAVPISSQADVDALMARLAVDHGTHRDVPRMPAVDHIDPISELKMLKPDAEVIVVQVADEGTS
jgi:hypothetical protein